MTQPAQPSWGTQPYTLEQIAQALNARPHSIPIYARTPCGTLRYYIANEVDRERIAALIRFKTLTPAKLEALKNLGMQFEEVADPQPVKRKGRGKSREKVENAEQVESVSS